MKGEVASALFQKFGTDPTAPDTVVLVTGDSVLREGAVVLSIYEWLAGSWQTFRFCGSRALPDAA